MESIDRRFGFVAVALLIMFSVLIAGVEPVLADCHDTGQKMTHGMKRQTDCDQGKVGMKMDHASGEQGTAGAMKMDDGAAKQQSAGEMKMDHGAAKSESAGEMKMDHGAAKSESAGEMKMDGAAAKQDSNGDMKMNPGAAKQETAGEMKMDHSAAEHEAMQGMKNDEGHTGMDMSSGMVHSVTDTWQDKVNKVSYPVTLALALFAVWVCAGLIRATGMVDKFGPIAAGLGLFVLQAIAGVLFYVTDGEAVDMPTLMLIMSSFTSVALVLMGFAFFKWKRMMS